MNLFANGVHMKKRVFYTELSYLFGLIILAIGTAFMTTADFGLSMVVAPAYILHLKLSEFYPFFSFGMAEYTLQAVILLLMVLLLRKAKLCYLFSFITAVIYGFMLDGALALFAYIPFEGLVFRLVCFVVGMLLCSVGVSLLFHTYIAPEAYELFVKEVSEKLSVNIHTFKTIYDCVSCLISIVLSFVFFGLWHFEGVKWGTVICALLNGTVIKCITGFMEKHWEFRDRFPLRKFF